MEVVHNSKEEMKKQTEAAKEIKVIEPQEVEQPKEVQQPKDITLKISSVQGFMSLMEAVLIGDDRLKPLQINLIEIIKRENEHIREQSAK